jgi:RNA polymerase sigma factor (sigma-70 family)
MGYGRPMSPFLEHEDAEVVAAVQHGDRDAVTTLVARHRPWIYNISLRMLGDPGNAEDATQDIFIKVLERIGSFEGRSAFRTWLYRVAFHHLLNLKRTKFETAVGGFENYEAGLKHTPFLDLDDIPLPEREALVEEAKTVCMTGMLLCLNRDQRLAFVLGSIFDVPHDVAAEILDVKPATFRKRLQRARADLTAFMTGNCGLINRDNPCRCARKTRVFMEAGYLDRSQLLFHRDRLGSIGEISAQAAGGLYERVQTEYPALYRDHPFSDPEGLKDKLAGLLERSPLEGLMPD